MQCRNQFYNIFWILKVDPKKDHPRFHINSYIALWSTPVINPIIYITTQRKYKQALVSLLGEIKNKILSCFGMETESEELSWD